MSTFLLSFVILALAVLGMAAGVLLGRRPIAGSCGGLSGSGCSGCKRVCRRASADDADEEAVQ